MKKSLISKILILILALAMVFTFVACNKPKEEPDPDDGDVGSIKGNAELSDVMDIITESLGNMVDSLKTDGMLHISAEAYISLKNGIPGAVSTTKYNVAIAGNFATIPEEVKDSEGTVTNEAQRIAALAKNEIKLEIKDVTAEKIVIGIYVKNNVVYITESLTQVAAKNFKFTGVKALNIGRELAKLPNIINGLITGTGSDILKDNGISDILSTVGAMGSAFIKADEFDAANGGKDYKLQLVLGSLATALPGLLGALNIDESYNGIIDFALNLLLGLTLDECKQAVEDESILKDRVFPTIILNANVKDSSITSLGVEYAFDKPDATQSDIDMQAGLRNFVISKTLANNLVVADNDPSFKEAAVKVSGEIKLPGVKDIDLTAEVYVNLNMNADQMNAVVYAKYKGQSIPLAAEYKVEDGNGYLFFDIAGLYNITGIVVPKDTVTQYKVKFNIEGTIAAPTTGNVEGTDEEKDPAIEFKFNIGALMSVVPDIIALLPQLSNPNGVELDAVLAQKVVSALVPALTQDRIANELAKVLTGHMPANTTMAARHIEAIAVIKGYSGIDLKTTNLKDAIFGKDTIKPLSLKLKFSAGTEEGLFAELSLQLKGASTSLASIRLSFDIIDITDIPENTLEWKDNAIDISWFENDVEGIAKRNQQILIDQLKIIEEALKAKGAIAA